MALTKPDDTMTAFFAVFTSDNSSAQKVTALMNLFCLNDNPQNPTIPAVGITHHGADFVGVDDVALLWGKFLDAFDDFRFAPAKLTLPGQAGDVQAPRLYSLASYPSQAAPIPVIGVQTMLSGDFVQPWFTVPPHNSTPLSGIKTVPASQNGPLHTTIPAGAFFAFNAQSFLITNLWMYLDRDKLSNDLNPGHQAVVDGFVKAISERQRALDEAKERRRKKK
jgi:hypothetical protein